MHLNSWGDRCHIQILQSKGYNPSFEVSKVASTWRTWCNFHIIIATIQTIEYWIKRIQCRLSYVTNVTDTIPCLKSTFLMWNSAILWGVSLFVPAARAFNVVGDTTGNPSCCAIGTILRPNLQKNDVISALVDEIDLALSNLTISTGFHTK